MTRPILEDHARELLGLSEEWKMYRWEVCGVGVLINGAIPNGVYESGKYKGQIKWKGRDKSTEAAVTIPNALHRQWLARWESDTGKCYNCEGSTKEFVGWSRAEGNKFRPCQRCGATGNAQPDKAVDRGRA